jgi:uncharacterized membrane protein (UPF0127 family)
LFSESFRVIVCTMNFLRNIAALAGMLLLAGCGEDKSGSPIATQEGATNPAAVPASAPTPGAPQGKPQPHLATETLWLGTNQIAAEVAKTRPEVMAGLMWRTNMAEMEGMLFVFPFPQQVGFWMKNTLLPLTCAYIGSDGSILELHDMEPHNTNAITSASEQVQYVLEMNRDWFKQHNVNTGVVVQSSRGTLSEVFFNR